MEITEKREIRESEEAVSCALIIQNHHFEETTLE